MFLLGEDSLIDTTEFSIFYINDELEKAPLYINQYKGTELKHIKDVYVDTYKYLWKGVKPILLLAGVFIYGCLGAVLVILANAGFYDSVENLDVKMIGYIIGATGVYLLYRFMVLIGEIEKKAQANAES